MKCVVFSCCLLIATLVGTTSAQVPVSTEMKAEAVRLEGACEGNDIQACFDLAHLHMDGKVTVAKVNIDDNPHTPAKYGVRGIPTLIIFKDGQVAATKVGALPKSQLVEWVESV